MLRSNFLYLAACTALVFIFPDSVFSQEQLGMRLERYAGIYSAGINPANTAFAPHNWEVSLFNADLFFENNYAFLQNTSLQNALRNTDRIVSVADTSRENPPARDAILQEFFTLKRPMRGVVQARIGGPGFSFRIGNQHVVGITTAFRSNISSYQIPEILAYRTISSLPRNQAINIPPAGFAGMAWGEIGLHYSHLRDDGDLQMAWGVSPKILLGYEGFYSRAQSNFDYTQQIGDTVAFGSARWDYALTTANLTDDADEAAVRRQGAGFGLDFGISWAMPAEDEAGGYAWRAGVSLVDAGMIRFKNTAQRHRIEFDTVITITNANFPPRDDAEAVLQDFSQAFLGDSAASLRGRSFGIGLPTALSAQFDVRVARGAYIGGVLVQRVPLSKRSVKRPSTLAVVPRFEHRWASLSLPLVLDDWQSLRVGAAVRLAWLYVGTDNVGSFFQKRRLSGADFYIGLKINGFSLNLGDGGSGYRLKKEGRGKPSGPNRRKIKCYQF
jgi:hypothetical protein